jgi:hypothetical protein
MKSTMQGVGARWSCRLALAAALLSLPSLATAAAIIETISGGGDGDGFPSQVATLDRPDNVSVGPDGAVYIAESNQNRIRRIDPRTGIIETIAGIGSQGFAGDGGPAAWARFRFPTHAVADTAGNVYVCDQSNHRIRKVDSNGIVTTVAGSQTSGYADGPALSAKFYYPRSLAVDAAGNVLIAEPFNNRVRYLNVATSTVSTIAGTGQGGFNGDNIPATQASLLSPTAVWSLAVGSFLIADQANNRIRKVDQNGVIGTIAGNGTAGFSGDGGQATGAKLSSPSSVSVRADGTIAIVDAGNNRVRIVNSSKVIQTVAGTGTAAYNGDQIPGTQAQLNRPSGIAFAQNDCLIADQYNDRLRELANCNGTISTLAGIPDTFTGDGWPALAAVLSGPLDAIEDTAGNTYIADGNRVRRIGTDGIIETIAGTGDPGFAGDNGPAVNAMLKFPQRIAFDRQGNLLVLDRGNRRLRRIDGNGQIVTLAGTDDYHSTGDGGPAVLASFADPIGLAVDPSGRIYIADAAARRVRMIDLTGRIQTIAGTGVSTGSIDGQGGNLSDDLGDNGPAVTATFIAPSDVTTDALGNIYVTDLSANRVRRIDSAGIIHPLAGTGYGTNQIDGPGGNAADDLGDGGPPDRASLNTPIGIKVTSDGTIYVADQVNRRIRVIRNGIISTFGGDGVITWSIDGEGGIPSDDLGDGDDVTQATFMALGSVFVDPQGNLLLTDSQSTRVRSVQVGPAGPPATSTPTPTFTPLPPTLTNTPTQVNTPTNVPPTQTRTGTATRTGTVTQTGTKTATPTNTSVSSVSVLGRVTYYANAQIMVPSADIDVTGPVSQTVRTDTSGDYNATNIPVIPTGVWTVEPVKQGSFGNAVSSLDAARVLQVIAGLTTFTPLQRLACDVTGDGNLSALDAVRILQFSAGVINKLPVSQACGSDWLFYPAPDLVTGQQVVLPVISGGNCQQGDILLSGLAASVDNQNFNGILFGDCTGNWTPSSGGALRQLAPSAITVHAGEPRHVAGNRVRVPIYVQSTQPFQALDVTLAYDANTLTLTSAHPHGSAANALIGVNDDRSGVVTISLASGTPIDPAKGAELLVEFTSSGARSTTPLALLRAQVDEQAARVVTHGTR